MIRFDFSASGPAPVIERGLRRVRGSVPVSKVVLWTGVAISAALYSNNYPGQFSISMTANGDIEKARFVQIQGTLENRSIQSVLLHVNGASQPVSVVDGQFTSMVPLTPGINTIHASLDGMLANLVSGSNLIRVNAQIAPADIWSALTWDGEGDIDLHLVLPDGSHCYFQQKEAGGATLDFDNTNRDGPEHIVMEKATPGKYQIQVVYYAQHGPSRPVRWWVDLRLRNGQDRYNYSGTLEKVNDVEDVTTFSFP